MHLTSAAPPIALEAVRVTRSYRAGVSGCRARARVLDGVSFQIAVGEIVAVCGGPGAGKSTLLRCAAGLLRPEEGYVRWPAWSDERSARAVLLDGARPDAVARAWNVVTTLAASGGGLVAIDHAERLGWGQSRRVARAVVAATCGGAVLLAAREAADVVGIADRALVLVGGRLALDAGQWSSAVSARRRARVGEGEARVDPPSGDL